METTEKDISEAAMVPSKGTSEKTVFPPPSAWYKSTIVAARDDMWAYSAGAMLILVKSPTETPVLVDGVEVSTVCSENAAADADATTTSGLPHLKRHENLRRWPSFTVIGEQREKYNCVSFCQSSWNYLPVPRSPLVSGDEGGFVRVWNLEKKAAMIYHDNHKGQQVTGVDWSSRDHSLIYSIDDGGTMTVWNVGKNTLRSMNFGKIIPTCLQSCPQEDNVVCFGTKGGNIFIVETSGSGKILAKVRHEEEVVTATWKPSGDWDTLRSFRNVIQTNAPILASSIQSMKVPSLRIWNRNGHDVGLLQAWEKDSKQRPFKIFGPACWVKDPNSGKVMLLSSGRHGEVISWSNGTSHDLVHSVHSHNAIFAMVQCGDIVWSLSYEPVIVGWNLRTMQIECIIPTFKGICTIAPSPVDHSRLAIGGTDSVIRVINCGVGYPTEGKGCTKSPTNTHKLKGKITAIAWHPTKDNCIGFGTDEGVLGIYELKDNSKYAMMFDRRVNGTVYTVEFGPSVSDEAHFKNKAEKAANDDHSSEKTKENFMLYACGGYSVFMLHPTKTSNPLINVSKIIEKANPAGPEESECDSRPVYKASEIRWSPDYSYFAVGYNDGRVELYSPPTLKLKCWIKCHLRGIQFLTWRPFDFHDSKNGAASSDRWFATASNDGTTRLHNLGQLFEEDFKKNNSVEPVTIISSEATLQAHGIRVISCAWSPHDKNLLVTVGYDCTAIVWNMEDGSHIARYMEHQQRLVACCFHPNDPFKLITVSDELTRDFSIHVWDYRQHPFRKTLPKPTKSSETAVPVKAACEGNVSEISVPGSEVNESSVEGLVVKNQGEIRGEGKGIDKATSEGKKHKKKAKTLANLLPSTANALINAKHSVFDELRYIVDKVPFIAERKVDQNDGSLETLDDPMLHLGLLGSTEECVRQIQAERNLHESKNIDNAAILSTWLDDNQWIKKSIKNREVTETILVIAASISRTLYLEALDVYADKLVEGEEYIKASTYYSLAGNIDKAVDVLVSQNLFREAVAMMKVSLQKDDPRVVEVMNKWLFKIINDGNYELATKIYCSMGNYSKALLAIEKRDFPYAYKAGCYIASKMEDTRSLEMFGVRFVLEAVTRGGYKECKELIEEFPGLSWLKFLVQTDESLSGYAKYVGEICDVKGFTMWKIVLDNILEDMKRDLNNTYDENAKEVIAKKMQHNLLTSFALNDTDAQRIISRNLTFLLFGIRETDVMAVSVDTIKLAKKWLAVKFPSLYFSVVMTVSELGWSYPPGESVPNEIGACQQDAILNVVSAMCAKLKNQEASLDVIKKLESIETEILFGQLREAEIFMNSCAVAGSSNEIVKAVHSSFAETYLDLKKGVHTYLESLTATVASSVAMPNGTSINVDLVTTEVTHKPDA